MNLTERSGLTVCGLLAAFFLVVGCSSTESDSTEPSEATSATQTAQPEPTPTDPAPTETASASPTSTQASGTDCTADALAPALGLPADSVFGFECKDGYAGVGFESPDDYDATAILSSDDGTWSKVNKSVCENDDFPASIKNNYCDVS